jgi:hypothetical protein
MHRDSIDQHLSSEGTIYMHAFRKPSPSASSTSGRGRARGTDVTSSTDSLTPNAMDPSLSGA